VLFSEIMSVHSVNHTGRIPVVRIKEDGNRQFLVLQQANEASPYVYTLGVKQVTGMNCTCWNVYFQRYCCTACAAAVAASMWSCFTQYSMHWPSHALWWDSSQFWTLTIWIPQGRSQISTRSTAGWVSSRWGSSRFRYWKWHALVTTGNRNPSLCENKGGHRWQQQYDSSVFV